MRSISEAVAKSIVSVSPNTLLKISSADQPAISQRFRDTVTLCPSVPVQQLHLSLTKPGQHQRRVSGAEDLQVGEVAGQRGDNSPLPGRVQVSVNFVYYKDGGLFLQSFRDSRSIGRSRTGRCGKPLDSGLRALAQHIERQVPVWGPKLNGNNPLVILLRIPRILIGYPSVIFKPMQRFATLSISCSTYLRLPCDDRLA